MQNFNEYFVREQALNDFLHMLANYLNECFSNNWDANV